MQEEQLRLTREQKEAIGLLSIGTFLEYFDLMLYVHMAVLLNELFFPQYDPDTTSILSAMAFCSTFIFRPIGALLFGWIGDNIGRKSTIIITTTMMAISCLIMANLPTYAQVGITASWAITICRIVQGMTSMGEIIGAYIYLIETIKRPMQFPAVASITVFSAVGTTAALGVASLATVYGFNWRIAFWIGGIVAIVGVVARTRLRETPEFVDMKKKMERAIERESGITEAENFLKSSDNPMKKEKVKKMTSWALFLIKCGWPVCFYISYIHCSHILKNSFGYSAEQIIHQNFIVSIIDMIGMMILPHLSYYVYPLKILKIKTFIFLPFILISPYLLDHASSGFHILLIQSFIMFFVLENMPATPIFYIYFPVFKRFTYVTFIYALSRAVMYVITSFGLIYLTKCFGNYGLLVIVIPVTLGFIFGIYYFEKLEKNNEALLKESKKSFQKLFGKHKFSAVE